MRNEITHIYPAGSLQQGFIYHAISQPEDDAYRLQILYDYHQPLDIDRYLQAWEYCITEYPILRTAFNWEEEIIQIVYRLGRLKYEIHDISNLSTQAEKDAAIKSIQAADRKQSFDLTEPTLMRLHIIKQAADYYTILKSQHHSISDGWSGPVLFASLSKYYKALTENKKIAVREDIAYQKAQEYIISNKKVAEEYWNEALRQFDGANDINALLDIPINSNNYNRVEEPASVILQISDGLYDAVRAFMRQEGITLNVILQFVWHKLLQVYSNSHYSIVGTTVSGRDLPVDGIAESVGLYINTLPLITDWANDDTITGQLHQIQQKVTEMNSHSFADLVKLQKGRERLFHTLFIYENYPAPKDDVEFTEISIRDNIETNNYPLSVMAFELDGCITIKLQYDGMHLSSSRAHQHLLTLEHILDQVIKNPEKTHHGISLLSTEEYDRIVHQWNRNDRNVNDDRTIGQLFEETADHTPAAIALIYEEEELSYAQLNEKSNRLARYIRKQYELRTGQKLEPDTLIALYTDRGLEMIIAILAVLKAGGAYVPVDPGSPQERINYILEDTRAEIILSRQHLAGVHGTKLPPEKVLYIDPDQDFYNDEDSSNLAPYNAATDLAYIIYTSGTTGRPKGVMVEHNRVLSFATGNNFINYGQAKVVAGVSNYAFDGSIFDIFFSLLNGKKLVVISDKQLLDLPELDKRLTLLCIDTIFITTALFNSLVQNNSKCFAVLQQVLFGGEACNIEIIRKFKKTFPEISLIHVYGPTENIVFSSYCKLTEYEIKNAAPIGKRLADKYLYVLDRYLNPVPVNVTGELYIGGAGVSRGYLNRPDLSAASFIANQFIPVAEQESDDNRLYKTGDMVRWLPDGNLEFIGRNDQQVKIRGYRIELGEIEYALSGIRGIRECCVIAKERKTESATVKHIIAYYITDDREAVEDPDNILGQFAHILPDYMIAESPALTAEIIMDRLKEVLPVYMLPNALVEVEFFPLTVNGKIDKRALPDPDFTSPEENYVAPSNETEIEVCKIWQEVLGLERVGACDDFFLLGGDSILSIRIVSKMEQLGYRVTVSDVLKFRDIQSILQNVMSGKFKTAADYTPFSLITEEEKKNILEENNLDAGHVLDIYPATYLQAGMLIESRIKSNNAVYNDVLLFVIKAEFNKASFEKIWQELADKNEQMRTAFAESSNGYMNIISNTISIKSKIIYTNTSENPEQLITAESNAGFDFKTPGLFRLFVLADENRKDFSLLFSLHHAIADGWSVASILSEFVDIYVHSKIVPDNNRPAFAKVVAKELEAIRTPSYKQFWLDYLGDYELKSNNLLQANDAAASHDDVIVHHTLLPDLNTKLAALARSLKISPDVIFLGAYSLVLSVFYNTNDLVIGTVVNNRLEEEGGDKVFGLHLNTIPVRFRREPGANDSVNEYLVNILHDKLRVNEHRSYPYGKIKFDLNLREDIYKCAFNYVHFHIAEKNYDNNSLDSGAAATKTNIPLTLNIVKYRDEFGMKLEGHRDFIDHDTAVSLLHSLNYYLEQFVENPGRLVRNLQILPEEKLGRIINGFNDTARYFPGEKTICRLFLEQAEKTPDNIALVHKGQQLTYRQLNEKSNQLARHIRNQYRQKTKKALTPDTLIPLYTDRSPEMIIGILGIMKAGAAYVPVDTSFPAARINYILGETAAEIILSQGYLVERDKTILPVSKIIRIDMTEEVYMAESTENPAQYSASGDLSYVIFTSGTTGKPKGVMVEHRAFAQFIYNFNEYLTEKLNLSGRDVLSLTNYGFDIFGLEYALPLTTGGKITISSVDTVKPDEISENQIIQQTPGSLLQLVTNFGDQLSDMVCLVGGEALVPNVAEKLVRSFKEVINVYGPAETVIWSTAYQVKDPAKPFIGKPLFNEQVYILDQNNNSVSAGITGNLFIGGTGLGRGYLNNPELTGERFIEISFPGEEGRAKSGKRVYKTGDLARWAADGNLEFIGRYDDQVKVNGYRIELGEIETALSQVPGISRSCVLIKTRATLHGTDKYLAGYYTQDLTGAPVTPASVSDILSRMLPAYMVPSVFVELETFPFTRNGKVDKHALPDPELGIPATEYVAPVNEIEEELCIIWQDVLGIKQVGTKDDFFKIGGNSILAIQVAHRMSKTLNREVRIADLFRLPSINKIMSNVAPAYEQDSGLIKPFQQEYQHGLPDIVMVHPANAGIEMYQDLANMLAAQYNCIGIDNYNIHNAEKISSLNALAEHYLSGYKEGYPLKEPVTILGWSLGGKIALEMAAILETSGYKDVHIILLDTFISDGYMRKLGIADEGDEESKKDLVRLLTENKYEAEYIEKVLSAWEAETQLGDEPLSAHLKNTRVTLFKANQAGEIRLENKNAAIMFEHFKTLTSNNINLVADKIRVINLDCTHRDILDTNIHTIGSYILKAAIVHQSMLNTE